MLDIVTNEKILLSICLKDKDYINKFEDNHFLSGIAKTLFKTLVHLVSEDIDIDNSHIVIFAKNDEINEDMLNDLKSMNNYKIDLFDVYYSELKRMYAKEDLKKLNQKLYKIGEGKSDLTLEETKLLNEQLTENISIIEGKQSKLLYVSEALNQFEETINERFTGTGVKDLGCPYLNSKLTTPAEPGEITTVYGASGAGKSTFVLNLFDKMINKRIPSLYWNIENTLDMSMQRYIQLRQNVESDVLKPSEENNGEDAQYSISKERRRVTRNKKSIMCFDSDITLQDLPELIQDAQKMLGSDYFVFMIDLFSMIPGYGEKPTEIMKTLDYMSAIAKRFGIHFVLVVQVNSREVEKTAITEPEHIEKLRIYPNNIYGGSALEQRSRVLISLFRKKHYHTRYFPEDPLLETMPDVCEVEIQKQNMGSLSRLHYLYKPEYFKFFKYNENQALLEKAKQASENDKLNENSDT